jgi:serine protease Do
MNRMLILLTVSALLCTAAAGQPSRGLLHLFRNDDRGRLGVSVRDVTKEFAGEKNLKSASGAYVSAVVEGSPAEKAGIVRGDVIVKFGDRKIDDSDDLVRAVGRAEPGDEVRVAVERNGETKTLTASLGENDTPLPGRTFSYAVPRIPRLALTPPALSGLTLFGSGETLGMQMQTLGKQLAGYFEVPGKRGVLVTSVGTKGSAGKAGMMAGDVIVKVNGNSVRDVDDVLDELRDASAETVSIEVVRKGKTVTLSVANDREEDGSLLERGAALREYRNSRRSELLRGLRESLMELKENLRDNARELRETLKEELRGR